MAATQPGSDDDELGPVDFLAIEFPQGRLTAAGFEKLISLADQGVVEILDMEFIVKDADGKSRKVDVWEFAVPEDGVDLTAWAGASSGLLDDSDVGQISAVMQPGSVAVVVIYENRWVLGLVDAWRRDGARLIADGGLCTDNIVAALRSNSSPPDPSDEANDEEIAVGILKTAATVAVASSVHGQVQRRQQTRWAAQDQARADVPATATATAVRGPGTAAAGLRRARGPPQAPAAPAQPADMNDRLAQLKQLGELL